MKLKDHTFPDYICVKCCLRFDAKNLLLKSAQAYCIHYLYCNIFSSFFARSNPVEWSEPCI